jgi:hypothetical protein
MRLETKHARLARQKRSLEKRREAAQKAFEERMKLLPAGPAPKTKPLYRYVPTKVELVRKKTLTARSGKVIAKAGERYTVPGYRAVLVHRNKYAT